MKRIILAGLVASIVVMSCFSDNKQELISISHEAIMDSLPGECPYLTKDEKGNTVLSWVRMLNDSSTSFCYAISKDGKLFNKPVVIPNSGNIQPHGENLPKIIFKPSGEIIALWGASNANPNNKYSGLVFYVQSFDDGKTWTTARSLVLDTASYDQRYYDVALLPNGEAGIIWLDNRKTTEKEGSALYFATTNGKDGFAGERLISQPCCQCCRTDLFIDSKGGVHSIFRGILQDSIRDMVHIVSLDGGKTFSSPKKISDDNWVLNGCPHTGPAMTETQDELQFAWFTGGNNKGCYFSGSKDNGASFSSRSQVSENGSHPQMTAITGDETVIVWDEPVSAGDRHFKKIGLQQTDKQRVVGENIFITADTGIASYPVVSSIPGRSVLIAYAKKKESKNYIAYRVVKL